MTHIEKLEVLRSAGGQARTVGLGDDAIRRFLDLDPSLGEAIDDAAARFEAVRRDYPTLVAAHEIEQIETIQRDYINFYDRNAVNPYVSLAARGPWIVTLKGAVIHDSGGYGMLGMGHAPKAVLDAMNDNQVMANVMTANVSQLALAHALRKEIGSQRDGCPYTRFLCLNSGSEAVTVAARLSDINAKIMTDAGGRHAGKPIKIMALEGGFHGRTDRPAQYSDSSRRAYESHMASFRDRDNLITVEPNNIDALRDAFARAESEGVFVESLFVEPVMGEGNPGASLTPEFYAAAHQLIGDHGGLLLVDSIQAGLRAHGVLSIVDYPGFESQPAPDMETYSKALNAGQYPLSVLAVGERAAALYRQGAYGNTMTTNPRAMDIACAVLRELTPALRRNIVERGREFLEKLETLSQRLNGPIRSVQGTGLLFSAELDPDYKCYGANSTEEFMRMHGVGVIHGGENSLRFTPHFGITSAEVDLVVDAVDHALTEGPRRSDPAPQARAAG